MARRRTILVVVVSLILLFFVLPAVVMRFYPDHGYYTSEEGPRIGVVKVDEVITGSTAQKGINALRQLVKDEEIKAIVVRIDSPGGMVGPSQELYREVQKARKKKPVVASLGAVAASGGYYIAAACQKIVASSGTITGSIGVISQTTHVQDLLRLAQVQTQTIKSGKFKDTGSPLRAMGEEDLAFLQGFVDGIHGQFVRDVAGARGLPEAQVRKVADGRILTGEQALGHKLIDKLGNYTDALELALKLAGGSGEPVPVELRRQRSFFSELLEDAMESAARQVVQGLGGRRSFEVREPGL